MSNIQTLESKQSFSIPFNFDMNSELPFSCSLCPEKKYKFIMGIANHYVRKHFKQELKN